MISFLNNNRCYHLQPFPTVDSKTSLFSNSWCFPFKNSKARFMYGWKNRWPDGIANVARHVGQRMELCSMWKFEDWYSYFNRWGTKVSRLSEKLGVAQKRKKSISPPHLWGVYYITSNIWNGLYHPLNFWKPVKLPTKAVLKNHSKSQKNYKMKNPIVLDSKWVELHSEYIIWYALVYFL